MNAVKHITTTSPYTPNRSVVASSSGRSNVSTEPVASSEDEDELEMQNTDRSPLEISGAPVPVKALPKPAYQRPARRRRAQGRHSKKQLAQFAALQQTDQATWATAVLLAACNVAYEMLLAEGWDDEKAKAFARSLAVRSGEKLGAILAGAQ